MNEIPSVQDQIDELAKPLPATAVLVDNTAALLVHLHELKARGYRFTPINDVERLLAEGRLS